MADELVQSSCQQGGGRGESLPEFSIPFQSTYLRRLITHLGARRGTLAAILLASLLLNLCGLAAPRITQAVLDNVIPTQDLTLLWQLLLILFLITAIQVSLTLWRRLTLVRLSLQLDHRVLGEWCAHLLSLPLTFFHGQRPGDLVARVQEHRHVRHLLVGGLTRTAVDAAMVVAYVFVMFAYSAKLALLVMVLAGLFAGYTLWLTPLLKKQHRQLLESNAAQEAHLVEAFVGVNLVKALAIEPALWQRWQTEYRHALSNNYQTQRLRQILESGGAAIQFLSTLAILGYGTHLVVGGELTAGQLVAFGLYAAQALGPLLGFITLWDEVQQARAAVERLQEIVDQAPEHHSCRTQQLARAGLAGHVQVLDVHFDYGDGAAVLRGVRFEAFPGECIALLGRNGSGKSTLARLLLGLYTPTQGRILIDGQDLADLDKASYRRQVGAVLQENLLVTGTICENIALGDSNPDCRRVIEAARLAGADPFITTLPRGYETKVGEQGLALSGGQRQLVGLARALYRNPGILILDEPTNALDHISQDNTWLNLPQIIAGRTVFLITHQAALVRHANRILVLKDGAIAEESGQPGFVVQGGNRQELFTNPQV